MSFSLVVKGGNITGNYCCCLAAASVVDLILAPNATACDLKYGSVAAQGYQDGGAVTAFSITNATATQTVAVAHASLAATGGLKVTDPPPPDDDEDRSVCMAVVATASEVGSGRATDVYQTFSHIYPA